MAMASRERTGGLRLGTHSPGPMPLARRRRCHTLALAGTVATWALGCGSKAPTSSGLACPVGTEQLAEQALTANALAPNQLSLTIDRVPGPATVDVSAYLANRKIKATFFVEGARLTDPKILGSIRGDGHLIGNGTVSNQRLPAAPNPAIDVRIVDRMITPYVVGNIFLLRAPDGMFDGKVARYLSSQGLQKYVGPIGWDAGVTADGGALDQSCWDQGLSPKACAQAYITNIAQAKKGIVRLTDGGTVLGDLVKELIPLLEVAGYSFVRLDVVPEVRRGLLLRGAAIDTVAGPGGCDDYAS